MLLTVIRFLLPALALLSACDRADWKSSMTTDPMTDEVFHYATFPGENGPWELVLECSAKSDGPFPAFRGLSTLALADTTVTGQYRVDEAAAKPINIGFYGGVLGIPPHEHRNFFADVVGKRKLTVEVTGAYPVMIFNIRGIEDAIATKCGSS